GFSTLHYHQPLPQCYRRHSNRASANKPKKSKTKKPIRPKSRNGTGTVCPRSKRETSRSKTAAPRNETASNSGAQVELKPSHSSNLRIAFGLCSPDDLLALLGFSCLALRLHFRGYAAPLQRRRKELRDGVFTTNPDIVTGFTFSCDCSCRERVHDRLRQRRRRLRRGHFTTTSAFHERDHHDG